MRSRVVFVGDRYTHSLLRTRGNSSASSVSGDLLTIKQAGHNNVSQNKWVNHGVGMVSHSFLFLPYFSWRITHLRHHKTAGSMELEEVYVPHLRSYYKLPPPQQASQNDYMEVFEELPIFLLARFFAMQFFGLRTSISCFACSLRSHRRPPQRRHLFNV